MNPKRLPTDPASVGQHAAMDFDATSDATARWEDVRDRKLAAMTLTKHEGYDAAKGLSPFVSMSGDR